MKILLVLILVLFGQNSYSNCDRNIRWNSLHFDDKVMAIEGFYKNSKGAVFALESVLQENGCYTEGYEVRLDKYPNRTVVIEATHLKKISKRHSPKKYISNDTSNDICDIYPRECFTFDICDIDPKNKACKRKSK